MMGELIVCREIESPVAIDAWVFGMRGRVGRDVVYCL